MENLKNFINFFELNKAYQGLFLLHLHSYMWRKMSFAIVKCLEKRDNTNDYRVAESKNYIKQCKLTRINLQCRTY